MRVETERLYFYPISNDEMRSLIEKEALWNLTTEYGMRSGIWNYRMLCS